MKYFAHAFAFSALLATAACSDDSSSKTTLQPPMSGAAGEGAGGEASEDDTPAVAPPPPRTREEYCAARAELSEAWCDYVDNCCIEVDREDPYFAPGACSGGHDEPTECMTTVAELEMRGARFDGSAVDACIADLLPLYPAAPTSCSGLAVARSLETVRGLHGFSQLASCRRVFAGSKVQGQPCDYQTECSAGLVCAPTDLDIAEPYICVPEGNEGTPCIGDSQCRSDLFCVGLGIDEGTRRCSKPAPLGEKCLYDDECQEGLTCSPQSRCAIVVGLGAVCDETHACEIQLGCDISTKTCVRAAQIGEPCTSSCNGRCDNGSCVEICGGTLF